MDNESKKAAKMKGAKSSGEKKAKREQKPTECELWLFGQGWIFGHLVEMY